MLEERQRSRKQNEGVAQSRMEKVLQSLDSNSSVAVTDMRQLREMMEMDRSVRSLETTFSSLYSKVVALEKKMEEVKEQWT